MTRKRRSNGQGTLFKRVQGGPWIARYLTHDKKWKEQSTRTTDRRDAERIISKLVSQAALRTSGVIDPQLEGILQQAQRTIESHLSDYEAKLNAGRRNPRYVATALHHVREIATHRGWSLASDLSAEGVNHYAADMKTQGLSGRTIHAHITSVKGFSKWLSVHGKLPRDPLASVVKPSPKTDRRRIRRALSLEEWDWLRFTTETNEARFGMSGADRVLLYATAIQTGLRSSELRSLTRGDLFMDSDQPHIRCRAGSTKNGKSAKQHVLADLAQALKKHVESKTPQAAAFTMPRDWEVADMLRADLADARNAWMNAAKADPKEYAKRQQSDFLSPTDHRGEVLDFHSLRHTTATWLAASGAQPKAIQAIMRHSDITTTMNTYGHLLPGQEADTVARLPVMIPSVPEPLQLTDGSAAVVPISKDPPLRSQQLRHDSVLKGAVQCRPGSGRSAEATTTKGLKTRPGDDSVRNDAGRNGNTPGRDRTCDPQIRNLLLYPLSYGGF